LASVLGREMRDLLGWIDPRRLPSVMGDDGFRLLLIPGKGEEIRSGCSSVVAKKGSRFEAEVANLEVAKWGSSALPLN
jgi:hypothetical protein